MKLKYGIFLLILAGTVQAEPYEWMNNPMLNGGHTQKYEAPYRAITEKNPYEDGTRTYDNRGNVWYTDVNPYNKKELRTRKIH